MKARDIVLVCVGGLRGGNRRDAAANILATAHLHVAAEQPAILSRPAPTYSDKEFAAYKQTLRQFLMSEMVLRVALRNPT